MASDDLVETSKVDEHDKHTIEEQGSPMSFASIEDVVENGDESEDLSTIQEIYHAVRETKRHTGRYLALLGLIFLTSIYLVVLYFQVDSLKSFQVSSAHWSLLPEGLTDEGGFSFTKTDDIYDWLNNTFIQNIWEDPECGNGICEKPFEYEAFGRFGCSSDCGNNPNVSEVIVMLTLDITSEELRLSTTWNLCMTYPTRLCWFEESQVMEQQFGTFQYPLSIPDGNWSIVLDAPGGGVVGVILYNGEYAWDAPVKVKPYGTLVQWKACAFNESATELGMCRESAATIGLCLQNASCTIYGEAFTSMAQVSNIFVDLVSYGCNGDFNFLKSFQGMSCEEIRKFVDQSNDPLYAGVKCPNSNRKRKLLEIAPKNEGISGGEDYSLIPHSQRRKLQADAFTDRSNYTETLWNSLGPDDRQRMFNLKVATQRAVYTWVGHYCLAITPIRTSPAMVRRFSAFFCTYFGGPIDMEGCPYVSNITGKVLTLDKDLAQEMGIIHKGLNISRERIEVFTDIFLWALQSVTAFSAETIGQFDLRMRQLDSYIVDNNKVFCRTAIFIFSALTGQIYNSSEIVAGDMITWDWMDDDPHAIKIHTGPGNSLNETFFGFGGGDMIVTRNTFCTPENIGNGSIDTDPVPCVLRKPGSLENSFSFSKAFLEPGVYAYADSRSSSSSFGYINVTVHPPVSSGGPPSGPPSGNLSSGGAAGGATPPEKVKTYCLNTCALKQVKNGRCNLKCNNEACAYDGGDCSCGNNAFGHQECSCPLGQARAKDGSCCQPLAVGLGLAFKFSMFSWGPNLLESNQGFLADKSPPNFRYVSNHNRVLVGLSISQIRWKTAACKELRFLRLYPNCTEGPSSSNYGVNPVFLPKSVLYNPTLAADYKEYYKNYSFGYNESTLLSSKGYPYAFQVYDKYNVKPTFHYIFDINFNNKEASESLQYLKDGYFLDNATKSLDVQLVTYNGLLDKFTRVRITSVFSPGGKIPASYDIQSISAQPYNSKEEKIRFGLEIVFVLIVIYSIIGEFKRYQRSYRLGGTFYSHYRKLSNAIDLISVGFFVATIFLWIRYALALAKPFSIKTRYNLYDVEALDDPGIFWDLVPPGKDFADAISAFQRVDDLAFFRTYYTALNGISILLLVFRILKYMDFQPRMGTITRTLAAAAPDFMHFFIMFFVIYVAFSMYGHLVFGRTLDQFRTLPMSLVTCFTSMLGDDSILDFLLNLKGWELASGVFFWFSFIMIMSFIIFNMIIAIIVEAFMHVREQFEDAPTITAEFAWILSERVGRLFTSYKTNESLLRGLRKLGADAKAELNQEREKWQTSISRKMSSRSFSASSDFDFSEEIIKVGDKELTSDALKAIFERASVFQSKDSNISTKEMAHAIFDHHKSTPAEDEEVSEEDATEKFAEDIERMKKAVVETIASVKEVVAALSLEKEVNGK